MCVQCVDKKLAMNVQSSLLGDILSTIIYASIIPGLLFGLYLNDIILLRTFQICLIGFFLIFFIGPLIYKFSYTFQRQTIFLNYINIPINASYANPEYYGLNSSRNFYITTDDRINLGVWQILPTNLIKENLTDKEYDNALKNGQPVFIYMHGNSGNRAADHRIELYKILREHFHVIAFDYRGYGDSSSVEPTEKGAVNDAITIIKWVKNITNSKIFVWGHSLGTGISSHALHILSQEKLQVDGLILESPFTSIKNEVSEHPSAMFFKNLPWFTFTVINALYKSGFRFETDRHIQFINCPILILHAEDDLVVPVKLGFKLYSIATENRTKAQGQVHFQKFDRTFGYGHKYICRAPELSSIIENFVQNSIKIQ